MIWEKTKIFLSLNLGWPWLFICSKFLQWSPPVIGIFRKATKRKWERRKSVAGRHFRDHLLQPLQWTPKRNRIVKGNWALEKQWGEKHRKTIVLNSWSCTFLWTELSIYWVSLGMLLPLPVQFLTCSVSTHDLLIGIFVRDKRDNMA